MPRSQPVSCCHASKDGGGHPRTPRSTRRYPLRLLPLFGSADPAIGRAAPRASVPRGTRARRGTWPLAPAGSLSVREPGLGLTSPPRGHTHLAGKPGRPPAHRLVNLAPGVEIEHDGGIEPPPSSLPSSVITPRQHGLVSCTQIRRLCVVDCGQRRDSKKRVHIIPYALRRSKIRQSFQPAQEVNLEAI